MLSFKGDPVEAIDGLLEDIDVDSVELQHKARKLWISRGQDVPDRYKHIPRSDVIEREEGIL